MLCADINEMLISGNSIVLFLGIYNVNRRNEFQRFRREVLTDAAVLLACAAGELDREVVHMVCKALLLMQHGCQHFIETLLGICAAVAFEQAARVVDDQPLFDQVTLQRCAGRIRWCLGACRSCTVRMLDLHGFKWIAEAVGEQANVFPRQFAAVRLDPIMVGQTETEVPHEQALRGGDALLLQKRGNVALTDRDGTAQPPFAQTVRALTAAERQQLWTSTGCDLEDSAGQIVELQGRNDIVFVHQIIFLLCHTHHLPAFSASSIP